MPYQCQNAAGMQNPLQLVEQPYWTVSRVQRALFAFIWWFPRKQSFVLCFQNRYWSCSFMNLLVPPACTLVLKIPMGLLRSFQQNLMWNTEIQQGKKRSNTYNVWIEGLHIDVACWAAGEGPDLGFVLKGSSDLWQKQWNQLKKLCLFSQVQPAIISPFSFLHTNVTVSLNKTQATPTLFSVFMDFSPGHFHIFQLNPEPQAGAEVPHAGWLCPDKSRCHQDRQQLQPSVNWAMKGAGWNSPEMEQCPSVRWKSAEGGHRVKPAVTLVRGWWLEVPEQCWMWRSRVSQPILANSPVGLYNSCAFLSGGTGNKASFNPATSVPSLWMFLRNIRVLLLRKAFSVRIPAV